MRISTILVPTDFSEGATNALKKGLDLARQVGAKVHLLYVQDESTLRAAVREGLLRENSTDEELKIEIERLARERLEKAKAGCETQGVDIQQVLRRGEADVIICRYAAEVKADLIVIGLRGAGFAKMIKSAVIGSVAESVIKKSPCPVLVVRLDQ